jgi:phosphoglycolate phosphatase/AHBA synthesis associated protein
VGLIRAVLFDLDGVLVHTYEAWFHLMNAAARDHDYPSISRETFHEGWGQGIQADIDRFFHRLTVAELERYYETHFRNHAAHMSVHREAPAVFAALRERGVSTAVITNTPAGLARQILEAARVEPDTLVGGTDVPLAKPAPDMVLMACGLLGIGTRDAIVVGDSRFDKEAAAAAGVRFVGYGIDGDDTIDDLTGVLCLVAK